MGSNKILTPILKILKLLNTHSRENSEITIEAARLINDEIASQVKRNLDEIKLDLNSHIPVALDTAITKRYFLPFRELFRSQGEKFRLI